MRRKKHLHGFLAGKTARKPPLGTGQRFRQMEAKVGAEPGVKDPAALAAYIGRRALGKARFQKLAAAGRRR